MTELLTVKEAAQILKVHPKTLRVWIREGVISAFKVGQGWRITGKTIAEFLEAAEKGTNA